MPVELFSAEYRTLKEIVDKGQFDDPLKAAMGQMKGILGVDGFDPNCQAPLDLMRGLLFIQEHDRILGSAGIDPQGRTAPALEGVMRAAALKFLRHLYLVGQRGDQKVWVADSPKSYGHYPSGELDTVKGSLPNLRARLSDKDEPFGPQRRASLGEATTTGLAWCQRANMALAEAAANPASTGMEKVKRWFSSSVTTEEDLESMIGELSAGFKKVTATMNSSQLISTDMPSLRGATSGKDHKLLNAYAFVFGGRYEKLPVVYLENLFFGPHRSPLPDRTLWALTVVHEITHIDCSTKHHRYDEDGLKCDNLFDPDDAVEDADSWAFFCADCAGALTPSQINAAMSGW
jgi:hypothetical protein